MHSIFSVPSITNPCQIAYHHNGRTPALTNSTATSSAMGNNGANARSLPLSSVNAAINRLVVASPHKWE